MKIRSLLTGLVVAIALTGCGQSPTAPEVRPAEAAFNGTTPPDTTAGTSRTGGGMGSGN